jgi:hypothetical protein
LIKLSTNILIALSIVAFTEGIRQLCYAIDNSNIRPKEEVDCKLTAWKAVWRSQLQELASNVTAKEEELIADS